VSLAAHSCQHHFTLFDTDASWCKLTTMFFDTNSHSIKLIIGDENGNWYRCQCCWKTVLFSDMGNKHLLRRVRNRLSGADSNWRYLTGMPNDDTLSRCDLTSTDTSANGRFPCLLSISDGVMWWKMAFTQTHGAQLHDRMAEFDAGVQENCLTYLPSKCYETQEAFWHALMLLIGRGLLRSHS